MKKLLIIEDDSFVQEMFSKEMDKYTDVLVLTATTIEKGEKISLEELPDIILLDLVLPDGSGMDLLRKLKSNTKTKKIKTMVMTNIDDKESMEEVLRLGVEDYFVKTSESFMSITKMLKRYLSL